MTRRRTAALALVATSTLTLSALASSASASGDQARTETVRLAAQLAPLNDSGASGRAFATVRGTTVEQIDVTARGLTPDGPHAMHIHYGDEAENECPTAALDVNPEDGFLSAAEGVPAYGPIVLSLTTTGDTTPDSALALSRMPTAKNGLLRYSRGGLPFTDVSGTGYNADGGGTAEQIAASVREGEGVLVIHGVDYDDSGAYSVGDRGIDPVFGVAGEAVDPATCGVLKVVTGKGATQGAAAQR